MESYIVDNNFTLDIETFIIDDDFTLDVFEDNEEEEMWEKSKTSPEIKNQESSKLEENFKVSLHQYNRPSTEIPSKNTQQFTYDMCIYPVKSETDLISHVPSDENSFSKFLCTCGFASFSRLMMSRHLLTSSLSEQHLYKCPRCSFKTPKARCLKKHMKRHDPNEKVEKCGTCGYETKLGKTYLRQHMYFNHGLE